MPLRLILISPRNTLINDQNKLIRETTEEWAGFIRRMGERGVRVAIWSNQRWSVNNVTPLHEYFAARSKTPVELVGVPVGMPARRRGGSVEPILQKFGVNRSEVILVGASEEDIPAGVNNQLLLIRPSWFAADGQYGFEVSSICDLERFCVVFGLRQHPIYWAVCAEQLNAYAMGPYSTKIAAFAKFAADAFKAAKFETGSNEFWHALVVSSLYFSGIIQAVSYIASYPGHSTAVKTKAIDEPLSLLGKCFNKTFYPDLFIRHTTAIKSAYASPEQKTYRNQINTVKLNRRPSKYGEDPRRSDISLGGKAVLIVDDICTNGRSLECARLFVEKAGGTAVLFSWLKTINMPYLEIVSNVKLTPYAENVINTEPTPRSHAYQDKIIDPAAPAEIADLLEQYNNWGKAS